MLLDLAISIGDFLAFVLLAVSAFEMYSIVETKKG